MLLLVDVSGSMRGERVRTAAATVGALAAELLRSLGSRLRRYSIVELAAPLRERQRQATRSFGDVVRWLDAWPERMQGVVVGNEVLDAMPVDLLHFDGERWLERGVVRVEGADRDRPRLPLELGRGARDLHRRASASSAGTIRSSSASSSRNGPTSVRCNDTQWPPSASAIART